MFMTVSWRSGTNGTQPCCRKLMIASLTTSLAMSLPNTSEHGKRAARRTIQYRPKRRRQNIIDGKKAAPATMLLNPASDLGRRDEANRKVGLRYFRSTVIGDRLYFTNSPNEGFWVVGRQTGSNPATSGLPVIQVETRTFES